MATLVPSDVIRIDWNELHLVFSFIYLGDKIRIGKDNQVSEIQGP